MRPLEKFVNILGTRGIPAAHGGFETFAERLALYLVERGWRVAVYCQADGAGAPGVVREDVWNGIERRWIEPGQTGARGTMEFDWGCVRDVVRRPGIDLVLGYNTALFNIVERLSRRRVIINMDGIEWKRQKWSWPERLWLLANELAAMNVASLAIADHPEIAHHLRRHAFKRAVVIPYGADPVIDAPTAPLEAFGIAPVSYYLAIGRIEPENSILEVVRAFRARDRTTRLVVLGTLVPSKPYHAEILAAAGGQVVFPGAIYDQATVKSLRFHARAYVHGHQVGGTNPSLVEALGAGNAVVAHDNRFNRWTAGEGQFFFADDVALARTFDRLDTDDVALAAARRAARARFARDFQWDSVLGAYERCLGAEWDKMRGGPRR